MRKSALVRSLLLASCVLGGPSLGIAGTLIVTDCGDSMPGGGPGQLRRLMNDASPGDTIAIPACVITLNGAADEDANAGGDLDVLKNLTLQGAGNSTVLDGNSLDRVFHIHAGFTVSMTGLVVRNGDFFGDGGGLLNQGTLTLNAVTLTGNASVHGGGLSNEGTLTAVGSSFLMNSVAGTGGGILNQGMLTLLNSVVRQNNANVNGGGLTSTNTGTLVVRDSTISNNNTQSGVGGGVYNFGTATIERVTLSGNFVESGGGIYNSKTLTVVNSTISTNAATGLFGSGGGIYNDTAGSATLTNVTVTLNGAGFMGGSGIRNLGTATLRNTIVARNECLGTITSSGHNLDGGMTCALAGPGDLSGVDPMLGPLANNGGPTLTHELPMGSPALDAGDFVGCPAIDQRGVSRPQGLGCDIGSYERVAPTPAFISTGDCSVVETGSSCVFNVSLLAPSTTPVTVQYATTDGAAASGADYLPAAGTLSFPAGATVQPVAVTIIDDALDEGAEDFTLTLSAPMNAVIADGQGVGTITDDDLPPAISVFACAVPEGQAGSVPCTARVILSNASGLPITVAYATADHTTTVGIDYFASSGTLSFVPGTTAQPIQIQVLGDTLVEGDETFFVNLSNPQNVTLLESQATNTIGDDDAPSLAATELVHGSNDSRDLQGGPDFYRIAQTPRSSYEVTIDATSGDIVPVALERLAGDNSTVLQQAQSVGAGPSVSLRWENTTSMAVSNQHIRVGGSCSVTCGSDDVYRIRAVETTYSIPRFNNAGTQVSVLILQNPGTSAILGSAWFWDGDGALLNRRPFALEARQTLVLNTSLVIGLSGKGGTITVSSDGSYGTLVGKTVALDPSTGFAFDTPMTPRRR
jgi:hypothetical protein